MLPHGWCYLWSEPLIALHVTSDVVIGLMYFCVMMPLLVRLRKGNRHGGVHWFFYWFAAFISLCGLTHFGEVLTVFYPWYWLTGTVKLMTAIVSAGAAWILYQYRATVTTYPTPDELQAEIEHLREFVAATRVGSALRSVEIQTLHDIVNRMDRSSPAQSREP